MKAVADTHHLQRRGAIWHYYRRVPDALAEAVGRRFIKRSLGVTSLADARKLRTIEDLKTDALFAAVEKGKASAPKEAKHSLAALIEHVRSTVEQLDKRSADALASDPISGHEELYDIWQEADEELCILTNPGDPRQYELVARTSQKILENAGAAVTGNGTTAQFAEIVRRGLIELGRRKIDRLENRYERPFYDNLFNPQRPPAVTARELANIFIGEKVEQHSQNQVSQKRTDKIKAAIDTVLEIIGDETPVHAIDDDVVQRVRSCLSRLPNNRVKIYPKLTIDEAIARAEKEERSTLAPPTQQVYLDVLRDLLQVAKRKKLLSNNPAEDVRPIKQDKTAADQKRHPLSPQQIKGFFEGEFYRSCAPSAPVPYSKPDREWRFWLPLAMLFCGVRPNEFAQLHVADIKCTDTGTWYLDLDTADHADTKTLKTETSRRCVPIHSELIRCGFLAFVDKRHKTASKSQPRLFYELKPNQYGNTAWYPVKRLNEVFLPAEISLGERQSLYSLRHSVRDALRRAKAPPEALLAICGWAPAGKATSDDYGNPKDPDLQVEWVEKIAYPGLDLSFLHVPKI